MQEQEQEQEQEKEQEQEQEQGQEQEQKQKQEKEQEREQEQEQKEREKKDRSLVIKWCQLAILCLGPAQCCVPWLQGNVSLCRVCSPEKTYRFPMNQTLLKNSVNLTGFYQMQHNY